ncbi:glycosyltransferase [Candidatus Uhrbacteria bacterium]|nr:glycosyltransferase [Candidatus Uhrbacteria bacterium]
MRIAYFTHINFRGTRAHVHNTLKTVEAISQAGAQISLISNDDPLTESTVKEIKDHHDIRVPFEMVFLKIAPFAETIHPSRWRRTLTLLKINFLFTKYLIVHRNEIDVVYYRFHLISLPAFVWHFVFGKCVIFESHYVYIYNWLAQALTWFSVRFADGVVCITDALRVHYNLLKEKSIVTPCHASESELVPTTSLIDLRKQLDLPLQSNILCYTGSLGRTIQGISYEVETLVDILPALPESYISVIVGVRDERDADTLRLRAKQAGVNHRVILRPWTDRSIVMSYLGAADILLMPRVGTAPGSSPSKMFDYLAMKKPIIAASTPPVNEILHHEDNALLINADQPQQWIEAIRRLIDHPELAKSISEKAEKDAHSYTWEIRGRKIFDFIRNLL